MSSDVGRAQFADGPPVEEHNSPVRDRAQLVEIAGDDDDDRSLVREIPDHAMLIDVRTDPERARSTIPNSAHLPLNRILAGENPDIARDEVAVIYCASGIRSAQAVHALRERGYSQVVSLRGGINAWLEQQGAS